MVNKSREVLGSAIIACRSCGDPCIKGREYGNYILGKLIKQSRLEKAGDEDRFLCMTCNAGDEKLLTTVKTKQESTNKDSRVDDTYISDPVDSMAINIEILGKKVSLNEARDIYRLLGSIFNKN